LLLGGEMRGREKGKEGKKTEERKGRKERGRESVDTHFPS